MKTKLTSFEIARLLKVQESCDSIIRFKDTDNYSEYDWKLSAISATIEDFIENCINE